MIVIGIAGKAGAGKDTVCQAIIENNREFKIHRHAFADALKVELAHRLMNEEDGLWDEIKHPGIPPDFTVGPSTGIDWVNRHKQVFRPAIQYLGTEYHRARDPFHWIKKLKETIRQSDAQVIIVPDVRFVNEYMFLKDYVSFFIKVIKKGGRDTTPAHASEAGLAGYPFDYIVEAEHGDVKSVTLQSIDIFEDIKKRLVPDVPSQEELTI